MKNSEERRRRKPDFMIIGAMKCATSTLHDQLALQSSFFMSTPKEPNFFGNDAVYAKGRIWYESLFEQAKAGQLCGESSTHYTKLPTFPHTVRRIKDFYPEMKFIYVMRHPIDRLVSNYIHEWTQGVISCDIDKALQQFPELISYSCYAKQLAPYIEAFGKDAVLPLFAERLRENPVRELQVIFDFFNIKDTPVWEPTLRSNVSAERIRACGWRDVLVNNALLQVLRRTFIPEKIRTFIRKLWAMKERPELSHENLKYLEEKFDNDLQELGKTLGIELTCREFKKTIVSSNDIMWKS